MEYWGVGVMNSGSAVSAKLLVDHLGLLLSLKA